MHYAWGAIVTSAARKALDDMRRACTGKEGVALYWDTDSCKGFNFDFKGIEKYSYNDIKKLINEKQKIINKGYKILTYCNNLKEVKISLGVKYIERHAFYGSNGLTIILEHSDIPKTFNQLWIDGDNYSIIMNNEEVTL